jgi:hypothetical protein
MSFLSIATTSLYEDVEQHLSGVPYRDATAILKLIEAYEESHYDDDHVWLAVVAEREACALIAESMPGSLRICQAIAHEIRNRGGDANEK